MALALPKERRPSPALPPTQRQLGGEQQKDHARHPIQPADHRGLAQGLAQGAGGADQGQGPDQAQRHMDGDQAEGPGDQGLALGDELGQEGHVEDADLGIEHVAQHPLEEPVGA